MASCMYAIIKLNFCQIGIGICAYALNKMFFFLLSTELRALVELIGPYGIRLLNETLMWHIGSQVTELKKLVLKNKDILEALRTNFDKPDTMKELAKRLQDVDSVLQRMTIVGVILSFKHLIDDALNAQLEERIPFLYR